MITAAEPACQQIHPCDNCTRTPRQSSHGLAESLWTKLNPSDHRLSQLCQNPLSQAPQNFTWCVIRDKLNPSLVHDHVQLLLCASWWYPVLQVGRIFWHVFILAFNVLVRASALIYFEHLYGNRWFHALLFYCYWNIPLWCAAHPETLSPPRSFIKLRLARTLKW